MIPYSRQDITQADIDSVVVALQSDFLTQGPLVPKFEVRVADYVGAKHAVAVSSATSALHIACMALGLRPGDWLWTSPITFVASANCALYCGAKVDFVDIDPQTYNLCPKALERKLEVAQQQGKLPKVLVPVHMCGQSCDMTTINALSKKYGFKIIEDASHAIGGRYQGEFIGNGRYSDVTVFSFHPVKIITTGEGGMALTNNGELANHMRRLRTHGITTEKELMYARSEDEIWNYQQIELGFNYRMTDFQAALGLSQMSRINESMALRNNIVKRYDIELANLPIILPWQLPETNSSYHLYPIRIKINEAKKSQRQVYQYLRTKQIAVNLHYIPVHRHPYYESFGFKEGDFPEAEQFHREVISIPIFPSLSIADQSLVIDAIHKSFA
jgi:UDP-4-amino-4,6-dideoxy-N-acetyl-beta-L-altrosamine transaminase